jgi:hypothetical protein
MKRLNKITNIALIFMLIGVFLGQGISHALQFSNESLRPSIGQKDTYNRLERLEFVKAYHQALIEDDHKKAIDVALQHLLVNDLSSIWGPREQKIENEEQLEEMIDPPLVEACKILFRKGIKTLLSSANSGNVSRGYAIIEIDSVSLSGENRIIAKKLVAQGLLETRYQREWCLKIPIDTEKITCGELHEKACAIVDLFNPQNQSVHNDPLLRSQEATELQNLVKFVANDIFEQDLYKRIAQLLSLRNIVIEVGQGGNLLASRGLKAAGVSEVITLNAYDSSSNHVDAAANSGWIGYSRITAECADAVVFNGSLSHVVINPLSESAKWVTNPRERNMRMLQTLTNALEALKSDGWLVITSVEFSPSSSIENRMLQQVDGAEVLSVLKKLGCDRVEIVRTYAPIDFTTRTNITSHLLLLAKKPLSTQTPVEALKPQLKQEAFLRKDL